MKILKNIIAVLFILYGSLGAVALAYLYFNGEWNVMFSGINVYKILFNILGSVTAIYGGLQAIRNKSNAVLFVGISVMLYLVGASYEIVMEHGIYFYNHIMTEYFWASGIQIFLLVLMYLSTILKKKANKQ